ncbi:MAG: VIT1/CCC1 family protein [Micrococcales bacterium]|nr:VIT1/CCC1 family protein [Micrococcales bacterium]
MASQPVARPTNAQIRRWRTYLADELAEATVYRQLAEGREGEEREVLLRLAEAEDRHAAHWRSLLPEDVEVPERGSWRTRAVAMLARRFGFILALGMAGRHEVKSSYDKDPDAPASMRADEKIHAEVIRGLAARGRARISGTFRAAVFGANDGLVSNLALILAMAGAGVSNRVIILSGVAGLLAGSFSMAAGEWVSVHAQLELLEAGRADPAATRAIAHLDVGENELALVYRSQGLDEAAAREKASSVLAGVMAFAEADAVIDTENVGTTWGVAISSFCFFAGGAVIPVLPFALGVGGLSAVFWALGLVGASLMLTGGSVGLLSGTSPIRHGLRQIAIGYGAAAVTFGIGSLFGVGSG